MHFSPSYRVSNFSSFVRKVIFLIMLFETRFSKSGYIFKNRPEVIAKVSGPNHGICTSEYEIRGTPLHYPCRNRMALYVKVLERDPVTLRTISSSYLYCTWIDSYCFILLTAWTGSRITTSCKGVGCTWSTRPRWSPFSWGWVLVLLLHINTTFFFFLIWICVWAYLHKKYI